MTSSIGLQNVSQSPLLGSPVSFQIVDPQLKTILIAALQHRLGSSFRLFEQEYVVKETSSRGIVCQTFINWDSSQCAGLYYSSKGTLTFTGTQNEYDCLCQLLPLYPAHSSSSASRASAVFTTSSSDTEISITISNEKLKQKLSNGLNERASALIAGKKIAISKQFLVAMSNSGAIVCQTDGDWETATRRGLYYKPGSPLRYTGTEAEFNRIISLLAFAQLGVSVTKLETGPLEMSRIQ